MKRDEDLLAGMPPGLLEGVSLGIAHLTDMGDVVAANRAARAMLEGTRGAELRATLARMAERFVEAGPPAVEARLAAPFGDVRVLVAREERGGRLVAAIERSGERILRDQARGLRALLAAVAESATPRAALQAALASLAPLIDDGEVALFELVAAGRLACAARATSARVAPPPEPLPGLTGEELALRAVASGSTVHVPRLRAGRGRAAEDGTALALPVRAGGETLGALYASGGFLGEGELRILQGLADAAGALLARARAAGG